MQGGWESYVNLVNHQARSFTEALEVEISWKIVGSEEDEELAIDRMWGVRKRAEAKMAPRFLLQCTVDVRM